MENAASARLARRDVVVVLGRPRGTVRASSRSCEWLARQRVRRPDFARSNNRRWQRDRQARVANSAASSTKAREGRLDLCFGRKFTARGLCQRLVDRREFLVTGVI